VGHGKLLAVVLDEVVLYTISLIFMSTFSGEDHFTEGTGREARLFATPNRAGKNKIRTEILRLRLRMTIKSALL
jgi:hypothetical protein